MHVNAMQEWNKKVDYRKLWRASSAPTKAQVPLPSLFHTSQDFLLCFRQSSLATP